MYILKEIAKAIVFRIVAFFGSAFIAGFTDAMFNTNTSGWVGLLLFAVIFCGLEYALRDTKREQYRKEKRASGELWNYHDLMSGSLIALYNTSYDDRYKNEYLRRLTKIGFNRDEADRLLLFESMILKYDRKDHLADPKYIYREVFDYKSVPLPQDDTWYAEHEMFLISELVKICDEAENTWTYSKDKISDESIRDRVYSLTRYGEAVFYNCYLEMVSEKADVRIDLLEEYVRAEQDLLYKYRWKIEAVNDPYLR